MIRFRVRALSAFLAAALAFAWVSPAFAISIARDTEIEEYLWNQTRPVMKAAGVDPNAVRIYLVNENQFNAFVSGGQNIFVFLGLIDELDTPNQVLGVMAHETGHIAGGHLARGSADVTNEVAPFLITMLAGLAAVLAGAGDAGMGIIMGAQQAMQRAVLGYTRVQENSADQAAITFLEKVGKSGKGMMETFEKFAQNELLVDTARDPFARSHPMSRDRMAALEARVNASPYRDVPDSPEDLAAYKLIQAKVRGFMDSPATTLRRYPSSDTSDAGRYARAIAYYRAPDFHSANYEIDTLLQKYPSNPYFWELKGQILAEQRDFAGAANAFDRSVKLKPKAPLLEVNLGATLVAVGNPAQFPRAVKVLESALSRDNSNAFAWLQLSIAYAGLGNEGMAALAMAEQRFNLGAYANAVHFATRAKQLLPQGSREADRADDIISIGTRQIPEDERDRRRR